jgi:hypothetical protein
MTMSGQYFLDDGTDIRIGCSDDTLSRLKKHQSSNRKIEIVGFIPTDSKEIFDEEKKAFNYFKDYKLLNSFYSRDDVLPKIAGYVSNRILERTNLLNTQLKRTGTIQTLFGEENLISFRERCDIFPEQYVTYMGKAGTQKGEKPRTFTIEGKTYKVSERAKRLIQSIIRDTKRKFDYV